MGDKVMFLLNRCDKMMVQNEKCGKNVYNKAKVWVFLYKNV